VVIESAKLETRDDLNREEDDFFSHLVQTSDAGEHKDWERRANELDGLLPGEKFHLRFVEKNFDGKLLSRWIVFCDKPPCSVHPGRLRTITVMTIEKPGSPGVFIAPVEIHLDGLRIVVLDWRGGRHAALERLEKLKADKKKTEFNDAINEAEGKVDDVFWVWKRAMGENLDFCLGEDGTGPNHGGKHFGAVFDKNKPIKTTGGIYLP
jgi:hypothetical protein